MNSRKLKIIARSANPVLATKICDTLTESGVGGLYGGI